MSEVTSNDAEEEEENLLELSLPSVASVRQLAVAFGMSQAVVRQRLRDCRPVGKKTSGAVYSLVDAASYLAPPRVDLDEFIERMSVADIPAQVSQAFWAGQKAKQAWEIQAGQLWDAGQILEVLTTIFRCVRTNVLLWPDRIADQTNLDNDTRDQLRIMTDQMLQDLREEVLQIAKEDSLESSLSKLTGILGNDDDDAEIDLNDFF